MKTIAENATCGTNAEIIIDWNILDQVTVILPMNVRGWSKLKTSEAWKEVCGADKGVVAKMA